MKSDRATRHTPAVCETKMTKCRAPVCPDPSVTAVGGRPSPPAVDGVSAQPPFRPLQPQAVCVRRKPNAFCETGQGRETHMGARARRRCKPPDTHRRARPHTRARTHVHTAFKSPSSDPVGSARHRQHRHKAQGTTATTGRKWQGRAWAMGTTGKCSV